MRGLFIGVCSLRTFVPLGEEEGVTLSVRFRSDQVDIRNSSRTCVPCPAADSICRTPPIPAAHSRMDISPRCPRSTRVLRWAGTEKRSLWSNPGAPPFFKPEHSYRTFLGPNPSIVLIKPR